MTHCRPPQEWPWPELGTATKACVGRGGDDQLSCSFAPSSQLHVNPSSFSPSHHLPPKFSARIAIILSSDPSTARWIITGLWSWPSRLRGEEKWRLLTNPSSCWRQKPLLRALCVFAHSSKKNCDYINHDRLWIIFANSQVDWGFFFLIKKRRKSHNVSWGNLIFQYKYSS